MREDNVVNVQDAESVEEIPEMTRMEKMKNFAKTKGRKIAAGAAVGGAAVGGFILAKVLDRKTNDEGMPIIDVEFEEVTDEDK